MKKYNEMKWKTEYDSDLDLVLASQKNWQWWTVSDGEREFRCYNRDDAMWLMDTLNDMEQEWCECGKVVPDGDIYCPSCEKIHEDIAAELARQDEDDEDES